MTNSSGKMATTEEKQALSKYLYATLCTINSFTEATLDNADAIFIAEHYSMTFQIIFNLAAEASRVIEEQARKDRK